MNLKHTSSYSVRLLVLSMGLVLAACTSSVPGEKLTLAPSAQIIGDTDDGGGIERCVADMMQMMTQRLATEDETDNRTGDEPSPEAADETEDESGPVLTAFSDEPESEPDDDAGAELMDDPESALTSPARASDDKNFGEMGREAAYESAGSLTESDVAPYLDQARRWMFGPYRVYVWRGSDDDDEGFALYHRDTLADARKGHFYVTAPAPPDHDFTTVQGPAPGSDMDGDGIPDLLLYEYSGGAHCCTTVRHIECGERPLLRAEIHTWHSCPVYEDLDGDGRAEVRFVDTSYAYWNECYAASPFPPIVLRIRNGRYEMAEEIMRAKGPSGEVVAKETKELGERIAHYHKVAERLTADGEPPENDEVWEDWPLQTWRNGDVSMPSAVWRMMLNLIYSGRCLEAVTFVDGIWPEGKSGKEGFLQDVADQVLSSWFGQRLPWIDEFKKAVGRTFSSRD